VPLDNTIPVPGLRFSIVLGRLQVTRDVGEGGDRRPPAAAQQLVVLLAQLGTR
jgi:hypothetical protein